MSRCTGAGDSSIGSSFTSTSMKTHPPATLCPVRTTRATTWWTASQRRETDARGSPGPYATTAGTRMMRVTAIAGADAMGGTRPGVAKAGATASAGAYHTRHGTTSATTTEVTATAAGAAATGGAAPRRLCLSSSPTGHCCWAPAPRARPWRKSGNSSPSFKHRCFPWLSSLPRLPRPVAAAR